MKDIRITKWLFPDEKTLFNNKYISTKKWCEIYSKELNENSKLKYDYEVKEKTIEGELQIAIFKCK